MITRFTDVRGTIARRVLINYRVDPVVLQRHLPAPFRPKRVNGYGVAGICLIRLEDMRPPFAPVGVGFNSENAAHRIAVEWDENGETREGVYIPIRHTSSRFNAYVGGRFFPGLHRRAVFWTAESEHRVKVEVHDGSPRPLIRVAGRITDSVPRHSLFSTVEDASEFFRCGAVGWSPRRGTDGFEGLQLVTEDWNMQPLDIEHLLSSWLDDRQAFPSGSIEFDSALLMRNIAHTWRVLPRMRTSVGQASSLSAPRTGTTPTMTGRTPVLPKEAA